MERHLVRVTSVGTEREKASWEYAVRFIEEYDNFHFGHGLSLLKEFPVSIDEFVDNPEFLGDIIEIGTIFV